MAERRVAVFIDAENMPVSAADAIMEAAGRHGALRMRRFYGNFDGAGLAKWMEAAPRHALMPCQTTGGAMGKNGADIALVIDVMDALHGDAADVFCLVTSDGDFTQLAMRVRQSGKTVIGLGRPGASKRFRSACDEFKAMECEKAKEPVAAVGKAPSQRRLELELLQKAFAVKPFGSWVQLSQIMVNLKACRRNFSAKAYGHAQLWKLLHFSGVKLSKDNRMASWKPPLEVVAG